MSIHRHTQPAVEDSWLQMLPPSASSLSSRSLTLLFATAASREPELWSGESETASESPQSLQAVDVFGGRAR